MKEMSWKEDLIFSGQTSALSSLRPEGRREERSETHYAEKVWGREMASKRRKSGLSWKEGKGKEGKRELENSFVGKMGEEGKKNCPSPGHLATVNRKGRKEGTSVPGYLRRLQCKRTIRGYVKGFGGV